MGITNPHRIAITIIAVLLLITLHTSLSLAQDNPPTATPTAPTGNATIHVVKQGDTVFSIAQRYGVTVDAVISANGLRDANQLAIGQRLLIPNSGSLPAPAPNDPNAAPAATPAVAVAPDSVQPGSPLNYTVQPGDSLFNLSWRFSMDVAAIGRFNNIVNPLLPLNAGSTLRLQEGSNGRLPVTTGHIYDVKRQDNLYRIAARFGVSIDKLIKVNRLGGEPIIFPGQRLVIPGDETSHILVDVPEPFDFIAMAPSVPQQGRTMGLKFTTLSPTKVTGQFMGLDLPVFSDNDNIYHSVRFGIHALAKPGIYPLKLVATDDSGQSTTFVRNIIVADGGYLSESIILPPDQLDLLDPNFTQPEINKILGIVTKYSLQNFLTGPMGLPCAAAVTSPFGTRRSYNNGPYDQFHTGTDFAALPGSPIYAPAGGVVVMAQTLNVRGNATIIDHGQGVFTGYWHQEKFNVKVGDVVSEGQIIGFVGGTGRATGPHLHWELFVNGVQVDPLQWTQMTFS